MPAATLSSSLKTENSVTPVNALIVSPMVNTPALTMLVNSQPDWLQHVFRDGVETRGGAASAISRHASSFKHRTAAADSLRSTARRWRARSFPVGKGPWAAKANWAACTM
ncbi:hypothetical protein GAY28_24490 [Azospirillum brasilense]|nr:hypothetical protein [Azospirillum brasilense]